MNLLLATADTALLLGLCYSGVALGLVVSLRFLHYPDLTVEGSFPLGGAVGALIMLETGSLSLALAATVLAGGLAGLTTASLHVFLGVGKLLSGILMIAVLYSVSLRVLGGSNLSLLQVDSAWQAIESVDREWSKSVGVILDPLKLVFLLAIMCTLGFILTRFFRSGPGLTIRALGDNESVVSGLGRDPRPYKFVALGIGNAIAALAGALVAFNQGFADVGMGQGALVLGLAALILGEQSVGRLLGGRRLVVALVLAAIVGSIIYQVVLLLSFRLGFEASDVKFITAALVLGVIVLTGGGSFFYRGRTF